MKNIKGKNTKVKVLICSCLYVCLLGAFLAFFEAHYWGLNFLKKKQTPSFSKELLFLCFIVKLVVQVQVILEAVFYAFA